MSGNFTTALQDSSEISLTVTGRVTKREISNPVWFVQEGNKINLLPVTGSDSDWYKNVLATPEVRLTAGRANLTASAVPVTDPAQVQAVVEKFRAKYGADQVAEYYPKTDVAAEVDLPASDR
jgi:deazaflavin-dependent oxidoreductase (nitroreductase family)